MKRFTLELEEIELQQALELLDKRRTVLYSYGVGNNIWAFEEDCIKSAVLNNARYFTQCSFLEEKG